MSNLPGRNSRSEWTGHPSYDPKLDESFAQIGNELGNAMGGMAKGLARSKMGKILIFVNVAAAILVIAGIVGLVLLIASL